MFIVIARRQESLPRIFGEAIYPARDSRQRDCFSWRKTSFAMTISGSQSSISMCRHCEEARQPRPEFFGEAIYPAGFTSSEIASADEKPAS